ncbi:RagB/SusD family nutrient uptake outer membrane protein [Marinilabiliaceae bacterium JC017]|nr:RagB/SusD family nutrient uptake outer membrane protein [Marinilabiliaceae bacterium JC017]
MKKIYNVSLGLTIALLALVNVSCDDFLDIQPVGKVIPETYSDFRGMLTASYEAMPGNRSLSTVRADEVTLDPYGNSAGSLKDIYTWNDATPDPSTQQFPWQAFYKVIFNVNHIINEGATATEGEEDQINQLLGESYLLRAYMYFYLVNTYAEQYGLHDPATQKAVPIVLDVDLEREYFPNTVEDVYKLVISDLEAGMALLNVDEYEKGLNYRFSKVSAYGFAARVYQFMNKWDEALSYANKALALNDQLVDFNALGEDAVMPFNYKSEENVLALEQTYSNLIAFDVMVSDKMINAYDQAGDLRLAKFFEESWSGYKPTLGKKAEKKVSMRTAEFYLIKAEALANNKKYKDAKEVLLQLLAKRLTPAYYQERETALNKTADADLLPEIWEERFRELAFQGFRWYDLRRTTRPEITREYEGETYVLSKDDARYTIRFPQEAVENNPNLVN